MLSGLKYNGRQADRLVYAQPLETATLTQNSGTRCDPPPGLRARNLSRIFGLSKAVDGLDLDIFPGQTVGLLGPNGAGKSTVMQMLTGNIVPSSGTVEICGIDLMRSPAAAKARLGYLPEIPPLHRELRVEEYLRFAARLHGVSAGGVAAAVQEALRRCDLVTVRRRLIGTLSHGCRQRIGIAQAIAHSPAAIVLDEPTSGLDPAQARDIRALIRELAQQASILLSTHFMDEAEMLCDAVLILREGATVFRGSVADFGARAASLEEAFILLTRGEEGQ